MAFTSGSMAFIIIFAVCAYSILFSPILFYSIPVFVGCRPKSCLPAERDPRDFAVFEQRCAQAHIDFGQLPLPLPSFIISLMAENVGRQQ